MRVLFVAGWLMGAAAAVLAQDTSFATRSAAATRDTAAIASARDLYASARYEEALTVLNGVRPADVTDPRDVRTIEQYRSLCLLALGRNEEAETAIAAVVTADPFYLPGESDASPRVRTTFSDVRERLLPALATERYAAAKAAYDRKAHADAERMFRELLRLLEDPQMNGRLGDLRVLTTGFVELAAAAAAPPPPPPAKVEPPAPVEPTPPPAPAAPKIYTSEDAGVQPPSIVRQEVPSVPASITTMARDRAVIELIIDEQGRVASMALRLRAHPVYDSMLLSAAQEWRYKPAMLNGTPVKYRKLLQVSITRR